MKKIVILGESEFDRNFIKILIEKFSPRTFDFEINPHHRGKESLFRKKTGLSDFEKNLNRARYSEDRVIFSCDLDLEADCISQFFIQRDIDNHFPNNFLITIQIREIESWILADPEGLERWTNISKTNFDKLEKNYELRHPKEKLLTTIATKSDKWKKKLCDKLEIQKPGDFYDEELLSFVGKYFDPKRARINNKSLDRFLNKLNSWDY